jgi:alpha-1,2-mannosyltransferase
VPIVPAGSRSRYTPGMSPIPTYDAAVAAVRSSPVGWRRFALTLNSPRRIRQGRLLLRIGVVAAALVAVKAFVVDPLTGHFTGSFEDFSAYLGAARSIAAGGSPYVQFDPSTVVMSGFTYPPFAAVLVSPLAALSDRAAVSLWLVLELCCTITAAIILARTALPKSWPRVELGLLAALAFAPATYNYWHGQINPLIFLLLVVAYHAYTRDREVVCGVCLGLAAGIKLAPIVLVLLLLRRHLWSGVIAAMVTGALTALIGFVVLGAGATHTFLALVFPTLDRAVGWIYNQSLTGAVSRLGDQSVLSVQPTAPAITLVGLAAAAVVLGLATWMTRPGERTTAERGAEFGMGVTAMLLAGSLVSAFHPHTHPNLCGGGAGRVPRVACKPGVGGRCGNDIVRFRGVGPGRDCAGRYSRAQCAQPQRRLVAAPATLFPARCRRAVVARRTGAEPPRVRHPARGSGAPSGEAPGPADHPGRGCGAGLNPKARCAGRS